VYQYIHISLLCSSDTLVFGEWNSLTIIPVPALICYRCRPMLCEGVFMVIVGAFIDLITNKGRIVVFPRRQGNNPTLEFI
jgi:hypothetical protein